MSTAANSTTGAWPTCAARANVKMLMASAICTAIEPIASTGSLANGFAVTKFGDWPIWKNTQKIRLAAKVSNAACCN